MLHACRHIFWRTRITTLFQESDCGIPAPLFTTLTTKSLHRVLVATHTHTHTHARARQKTPNTNTLGANRAMHWTVKTARQADMECVKQAMRRHTHTHTHVEAPTVGHPKHGSLLVVFAPL